MGFAYEKPLANGNQEALAEEIFKQVRCVVCSGESLNSSEADFSVDMRAVVREQVSKGQSEERVLQFLTDRYGAAVLQAPPKAGASLLLWLFPMLLLFFGAIKIIATIRAKKVASSGKGS